MLTSAHNHHHHHHQQLQNHHHHNNLQSSNNMPVAASPCSTSSSSLGFQGSMSSSVSDLLNSSNSSFGESSTSSVRSSPKRHLNHHHHNDQQSSSVPRVRTIRLKRPSPACAIAAAVSSATTTSAVQPPQSQLQSRNLLIGGGGGGSATNSLDLAGIIASPSHSSLFGFSIRGGSEYRTGFFVSHVEPTSEADVQGVQVGDQIIRVNNHPVDDATHKELSQYIANQSHLTLRVRNIGMIPVKDRDTDPLTWQMIQQDQKSSSSSDYDDVIQCRDILVTLSLGPKEKLGLGICKGPEWKPGIFVQFTKEQGIARRAGLKPGDQILSCNGVEFHEIFFNDAVAVMKSTSHLELIIRTAVGLELFPGESSGYNSSASSVTGGDQSPCWNESGTRRYDVEGRMNPSKMKSPFKPKSSTGHRDRLMAVNTPKVPQLISFQNTPSATQKQLSFPMHPAHPVATAAESNQNTTIIKLSQDGTMINNTLIPNVPNNGAQRSTGTIARSTTMVRVQSLGNGIESCGRADQQESEQRTVVVEVHRGASGNINIPPPPPLANFNGASGPSVSVIPSIADEIKRKAESLQQRKEQSSIDDRMQMKAKANGMNSDQHNQLMDEFKKAHQKMFKNGNRNVDDDLERQRERNNNEVDRDVPDNVIQVPTVSAAAAVSTAKQAPAAPLKTFSKNHFLANGKSSPSPPPPPPPEPCGNKIINSFVDCADVSPPPPIEFADDVPNKIMPPMTKPSPIDNSRRNGAAHRGAQVEKPVTPTPDYDSLSYTSMEYNQQPIKSQTIPPPAPPMQKLNLVKQSSWSASGGSSKGPAPPKPNRAISVTIGEYDSKREPSKLGFLNKGENNGESFNGSSSSEMLKNELQMTLNRSNLLKSGEAKTVGVVPNQGNGTLKTSSRTVLEKTGSANIERLTSMLNSRNQLITNNTSNGAGASSSNKISNGTNKVTISIPKVKSASENEVKISPNGILKTPAANGVNGISSSSNGSSAIGGSGAPTANGEVKNIKFDNITTVIGIRK